MTTLTSRGIRMRSVKHLGPAVGVMLAVVVGLGACSDVTGPVANTAGRDQSVDATLSLPFASTPTPLRFRRGAPPLEQSRVSFYATKGQAKSVSLYFKTPAGTRGSEYARLVIPAAALSQRPNGTPIARGDSVLITVSAPDPSLLLLRMEPHGLRFDSQSPARLTMRYHEADRDFNRDGVVNIIDTLLELRLAIWRQPTLADLFAPVLSLLDRSIATVSADLRGFSQYIIAY